jgi:hypothetical protein
MKSHSSGCSIYLLIALALGTATLPVRAEESEAAVPSGPRIEVEESEIDLGVISKGAPAEATFTLRNSGDQTLEIIRAKPG